MRAIDRQNIAETQILRRNHAVMEKLIVLDEAIEVNSKSTKIWSTAERAKS
jgi:hypothetical protein